jgi:hypothetical protein
MASASARELEPGPAAFYGVRESFVHLLDQAKREGLDWWIVDNSYFDVSREISFRITRNAMQCDGLQACWSGEGPDRFRALGLEIKPWRQRGGHIVVCPQSDEYMRLAGWQKGHTWLHDVEKTLRTLTDRPLRIRSKLFSPPLSEDLKGAWALVTHASAAANEALLAGIPVFCTGRCAAQWLGSSGLSLIESPQYPDGREEWAAVLAENQWDEIEIRDGKAWESLNA